MLLLHSLGTPCKPFLEISQSVPHFLDLDDLKKTPHSTLLHLFYIRCTKIHTDYLIVCILKSLFGSCSNFTVLVEDTALPPYISSSLCLCFTQFFKYN